LVDDERKIRESLAKIGVSYDHINMINNKSSIEELGYHVKVIMQNIIVSTPSVPHLFGA
jgi:hypothetical protein